MVARFLHDRSPRLLGLFWALHFLSHSESACQLHTHTHTCRGCDLNYAESIDSLGRTNTFTILSLPTCHHVVSLHLRAVLLLQIMSCGFQRGSLSLANFGESNFGEMAKTKFLDVKEGNEKQR